MRNNKAKLIIAIPTAVIFFLLLVVLIFIPDNRFWTKSESACMQNNKGEGYCEYVGQISYLYSNFNGLVLVGFESPVDVEHAAKVGINIRNGSAGSLLPIGTPVNEVMLEQLLMAHEKGRKVKLHMHDSQSGYPMIDYVWVY